MNDELIIRVDDIRATNLCLSGARRWFAVRDLSWSHFIENGMPLSQAESYHDAFADAAIVKAKLRAKR